MLFEGKPNKNQQKRRTLATGGAKYTKKTLKAKESVTVEDKPKKSLKGLVKFGSVRQMLAGAWRISLWGFFAVSLISLVSAGLVAGYLYVSKSDYFAVRKVTISGLNQITREEILTTTGLDKPTNILSFDADDTKAILGSLTWVESVEVERIMPDAVNIIIHEFKPRTLVNLGSLYFMDENGYPFKKLEPGENPDLPIVSGFTEDELINPGPLTKEALSEVFWLIDALSARNDDFKVDNISEIHFDSARGLTIFTRQTGIQVKIGFGAYEEKLRRLGRVLAYLKTQGQNDGVKYFNLETAPRVTVRYDGRSPAQEAAREI